MGRLQRPNGRRRSRCLVDPRQRRPVLLIRPTETYSLTLEDPEKDRADFCAWKGGRVNQWKVQGSDHGDDFNARLGCLGSRRGALTNTECCGTPRRTGAQGITVHVGVRQLCCVEKGGRKLSEGTNHISVPPKYVGCASNARVHGHRRQWRDAQRGSRIPRRGPGVVSHGGGSLAELLICVLLQLVRQRLQLRPRL